MREKIKPQNISFPGGLTQTVEVWKLQREFLGPSGFQQLCKWGFPGTYFKGKLSNTRSNGLLCFVALLSKANIPLNLNVFFHRIPLSYIREHWINYMSVK